MLKADRTRETSRLLLRSFIMRYLSPAVRRSKTNGSAAVLAILGLICIAAAPASAAGADDAEKSPAQLVPASGAAYFEVSGSKDVIALLLDHPISKLIQQTPDFRKSLESAQYKEFLGIVGLVERRAGV